MSNMTRVWSKQEIIDLMLRTVRETHLQCVQLGQPVKIEDTIEQVFDDLDEAGLIEREP